MTRLSALLVIVLLAGAGCNDVKQTAGPAGGAQSTAADTDITANLNKLSTEDRALAAAQKLCPVTDEPLGSMGVPIKLAIKDQPVLICCKGCEKSAKKDPDKTLQKVVELKAKGGKDR